VPKGRTILHLTSMGSDKYGGVEHYLLEVARRCRERGYRTVLQYESRPESPAYLRDLADLDVELAVLPIIYDRTRLQCIAGAARLIARYRPEILQTHFVSPAVQVTAPLVAWAFGARKVVALVHSHPRLRKGSHRGHIVDAYSHVLGVSDAVSDNLVEAGARRGVVATHYLGIFGLRERSAELRDRFRRELGLPAGATVLACIGFDIPFKGLDILLPAFERAARARPDLHLMIVGVKPEGTALSRQAEALGIAGRVRWPGIVDEGWKLLNAADVYVQSSRYAEGLPLAVMEAMALGLPVVATRVTGVPEAVLDGETGVLVEPDNVEALAAGMERMLGQRARWGELGAAGRRRYLERFQGEASADRLVERYYGL
jgi:glycosyltransferase involved in cell wall biosynthesis